MIVLINVIKVIKVIEVVTGIAVTLIAVTEVIDVIKGRFKKQRFYYQICQQIYQPDALLSIQKIYIY